MKKWLFLLIGAALLAAPFHALAVPMTFDLVGVNDPTLTATVVFEYVYDEDTGTGKILIDITNTSDNFDPRLTGFAFNIPDNVTGVSGFVGPTGWDDLFSPNAIDTPGQYGFYDLAGVTGTNFQGGDPNEGIPRGETYHFEFTLEGTDLDTLDEMDFLGLLAYDPPGNPDEAEQYFIVRFQRTGADGQGSDVGIPQGDPSPVPAPASALLLGTGLAGLTLIRMKRRAKRRCSGRT